MVQWKQIRLGTMRLRVQSLASFSGLKIHELWCSHRHGSDAALLWLWCRPAAKAPIQPQAWEPPYAMGVALKKMTKDQKKPQKQKIPN